MVSVERARSCHDDCEGANTLIDSDSSEICPSVDTTTNAKVLYCDDKRCNSDIELFVQMFRFLQ